MSEPGEPELTLITAQDQAARLLEAGDVASAEGVCSALLSEYPHDIRTHLLMGEVQYELGNYGGAGGHFLRALAADPENPSAHVGMALVAEVGGNVDSACREYTIASQLNPSAPGVRERIEELSGAPQPALHAASLVPLKLETDDPLSALAAWDALDIAAREEPWMRLALLEALWRSGRERDAADLASELESSLPEAMKPKLVLAWHGWLEGDPDAAGAALAGVRAYDASIQYVAAHSFMAPPGWPLPDWDARVSVSTAQLAVTGDRAERPPQPEDLYPSVAVSGSRAGLAEVEDIPPVVDEDRPAAWDALPVPEGEQAADLRAFDPGVPDIHSPALPGHSAGLDDPYSTYATDEAMPSWWTEPAASASHEDPIQAPTAFRGEPGLDMPDAPEAPYMPGALDPQPEITDLPTGPDTEPPEPLPEIQPGYTPGPEITDIPPATSPEILDAPMGEYATQVSSVLSRAEDLESAGYYADALELYAQAFREGQLETPELLSRVTIMEPYLIGYAPWHRLLGDLYRRSGYPRRAMREYQLALHSRRIKG